MQTYTFRSVISCCTITKPVNTECVFYQKQSCRFLQLPIDLAQTMKIALLTDKFVIGGGLSYLRQIASGLPHHTFIICGRGGDATSLLDGLSNVVLEPRGYWPWIVADYKPDLLHFNHLRPLVAHCILQNPLPLPSVNTVHGIHLRRYDFIHGIKHRHVGLARRTIEKHS
jgi:hypothetical protein